MKIFYIHHANREINGKPTQNDNITKLGEEDAKNMSKTLEKMKEKFNIKAIYTSPFLRCKKTAQIINENLEVPMFEDARLNEFKSIEQETWSDCQKRIISLIKEIVYKYDKNDTVLCVTSGVNLTAFIAAAYNLEPSEKFPFPLVATCSPIGFEITRDNFE